jgi:hypothetical protein
LWVIFALLDPDPYSNYGSGSGSTLPIEYGSNTNTDPDPDPQPCLKLRIHSSGKDKVVGNLIGKAYLPTQILVVRVTHIQGLGCEGIRLHLHICSGNLVDETGLADVGKSLKKK